MPRCRCGAFVAALVAALLLPSPASAWGFAAHRFIMRRAIDILPGDIKPFFVQHREELVSSIDLLMKDTVGAWRLLPDGCWERVRPEKGDKPRSAQATLMRRARRRGGSRRLAS